MDQCTHCTIKGDIEQCELTECSIHETWYVKALKDVSQQAAASALMWNRRRFEEIVKMVRDKADLFMKEDGSPGLLSSLWGWRDQADTLKQLADEIEGK